MRAIEVARREVPALHALLVGDGPLRDSLLAEISSLGLEGFVHLTGFRTDPESIEAAASVVVLTSKSLEGTPGVLIDALALGKPIVATHVGGVPEVIEDGVSGLIVNIGDAESLGRAIARVLRDPALAALLSAGALTRAPMFSIENTVNRTMDVYRELLAEDGGAMSRALGVMLLTTAENWRGSGNLVRKARARASPSADIASSSSCRAPPSPRSTRAWAFLRGNFHSTARVRARCFPCSPSRARARPRS